MCGADHTLTVIQKTQNMQYSFEHFHTTQSLCKTQAKGDHLSLFWLYCTDSSIYVPLTH